MNEELRIIITAEIAELRQSVEDAQKQIKNLEKNSESSFSKLGNAAKAVGKTVAAGLKVAITGIAAAGAAMVGLAEGTREYREDLNKLNSAFTSAGMSSASAGNTFAEMYRNIGETDAAVEAAQQIALLADSEAEAAQWAEYASGVVATFGDALPVETFYEGANETLKLGEATGAFAQMLEGAGLSVEDFNAELLMCNTEQEKQALMLKYTEEALGDAGRAYKEANADIYAARDAQLALNNSLAAAGGAVEPVVTVLKQGLANALQSLIPGLSQASEGLQDIFNGVEGGEEKLKEGIQSIIDSLLTTITNVLPTVLTMGVEIITALIQGLITAFPTVVNTIVSLLPQIVDALATLIPQLLQGVVQAIDAIVEALPDLIATIMNALPTLLPQIIDAIVDVIVTLCENFGAIIQPIIDALPDIIVSIVNALMDNLPALIGGLISLVLAIVDAIPDIIEGLIDALPTVISSIISALIGCLPQIVEGLIKVVFGIVKSLPQIFKSLVEGISNIFVGIWDGFKNGAGKAWEGVKQIFGKVGDFFKNTFSNAWSAVKKVFSTGGKIFDGIKDGIVNAFKTVVNAIIGGINKVVAVPFNAINSALSKLKGISIVGLKPFNWIKTVDVPQIPKLAKGGIVDSATLAMIGERGREVVMPLENNTEWIEILAQKISSLLSTGNNRPIILQVDGTTFARTAVTSINNLTRQQGKMSLNLV